MPAASQIDVAIAGGGPGGLAAAAAIIRALPDCRVQACDLWRLYKTTGDIPYFIVKVRSLAAGV